MCSVKEDAINRIPFIAVVFSITVHAHINQQYVAMFVLIKSADT